MSEVLPIALIKGKTPEMCQGCGRLDRCLIKKFYGCRSDCNFTPRCAHCMYLEKYCNPSNLY